MSKVFIGKNKWFVDDDLIRMPNNKIDWKENVGKTIEFKCLDYIGCYTIKNVIPSNNKWYKHEYVIYFDNDKLNEHIVNVQNLSKVNFSYILGLYSNDFLYDIGDIVNDQFLILKREHKKLFESDKSRIKTYMCKCLLDGHIFENSEKNLKTQKKCEACLGRVIIKGVNDMATTRPEIVKFLKNEEDAYQYSAYSEKVLEFSCDICGKDFKISPGRFGFNFPCGCYSSDSYPNRLIQEVFNQLKIPYIRELRKCHFEWCENYKYDLYFEQTNQKYIVEMDGGLHKGERLEIDKIKDKLANENGVKVIRIDCDYSKIENRLEYIKNNIFLSHLSKVVDLSNIDWNDIDKKIMERSITKEICDLRNQGYRLIDIADFFSISVHNVNSHLNIGRNNNLLNEWAMSKDLAKTIVVKIINLTSGEIQYCVGICKFYNESEKYIGIKADHNKLKRYSINGHIVLNEFEIEKLSYYDYIKETATV